MQHKNIRTRKPPDNITHRTIMLSPSIRYLLIGVIFVLVTPCHGRIPYDRQVLNMSNGFPSNDIRTIHQDNTGFLWFSTLYESYRYDGYEYQKYPVPQKQLQRTGSSVLNSDGNLSFIRQGRSATVRIYPTAKIMEKSGGKYAITEFDGKVWISTYGNGLFSYDIKQGSVQHYTKESGFLTSNYIKDIATDRNGNLWISEEHEGILLVNIPQVPFEVQEPNPQGENERSNDIKVLYRTNGGRVLAADNIGGLHEIHLNPAAGKSDRSGNKGSTRLLKNAKSSKFTSMAEDKDGNLWLSMREGGLTIAGKTYYHNEADKGSLMSGRIDRLQKDRRGRMWICSVDGKLDVVEATDKSPLKFRHLLPWLKGTAPRGMIVGRDGDIYIGLNKGILVFNPDKLLANERQYRIIPITGKGKTLDIYSLAEDEQGRIWAGTGGEGLFIVSGKDQKHPTIDNIKENDGLSNNVVNAIIVCHPNRIVTGTLNGCSVITFANGKRNIRNVYFGSSRLINHTNENSILKANGKILFGSLRGVIEVPQKALLTYTEGKGKRGTRLTSLRVNGITVPSDSTGSWQSHQNSFTFSVSDFTFIREEQSRFSFYLEGHDTCWSKLTPSNLAEYKDLPAGDYTLHVRSLDILSGKWDNDNVIYSFTVLSPLWRRWWMLMIYAAIALILSFVAKHWIKTLQILQRKLREKQKGILPVIEKESQEQKFVQEYKTLVANHLSDNGLTPDMLAKEMGYSRSAFYKKVSELTGMTPKSYITQQRMEQAAMLLQDTHTTVSEVAYKLGYSNPQYFSTAFKQYYNISPSKYQNAQRPEDKEE